MARPRTKKRTAQGGRLGGAKPAPGNAPGKPGSRTPKSMVIRTGASEVGPSVSQLVRDVRTVLEPQTAIRLKEMRGNKLKDYVTMAGPLGVTHLLLFSRSKDSGNVNLRLCVTPHGPTMHFRVEKYSLCKDVFKSQRRPRSAVAGEYLAPPLLVMNNFTTKEQQSNSESNGEPKQQPAVPKHLESLSTTLFQSLFPPINPTQTPLKSIKRVLLLDRQTSSSTDDNSQAPYVLNLRHYNIETRTAKSVPKPLRRLDAAEKTARAGQRRKRGALPNLGKLDDVADYLLDPHAADGFTSASESEPDTDAEVEVLAPTSQRVQDRRMKSKVAKEGEGRPERRGGNRQPNVERKGIKLHELGPRLRLRLTKVEEGLCKGKVMWHEYISKSAQEVKEMDKVHEARRLEKERRRQEQKENVERKRKARGANGKGEEGEEGEDEEDEDLWADYDDDEMLDAEDDEDANGGGEEEDGMDEDEDEDEAG